ncbi:hypothetical protein [Pseudomonas sp. CFBP 13719]|uniref:hypothetical protein n=1 Tax=Pseudomonas sp. CFBP 13719 TaxID=2775303 RepID=UPI00178712AC|nr:hypothetical protein [Pseudomonas sp. CFBP 13719]MBD8682394.1 hypothetical protein [Pseudomonas sp. CFBP 13719]
MDFSLENFIKPHVDEVPSWANSPSKIKLHTEIISQHKKILGAINKEANLSIKERQIVARQIAKACGLSPSIISERRQPEICKLITDLNNDLELTYNSAHAKIKSGGTKRTKREIERAYRNQADEIKRLTNLRLGEAMTTAINSVAIQRSKDQAATIAKLKSKIFELEAVIERQAIQLQRTFRTVE